MRKQYLVLGGLTLLVLAATTFRGTAGSLLRAAGLLGGHAQAQGLPYTPVITPNGSTLPFTVEDGVKVFRLTVEACRHEIAPGMVVNAWCYNGQTPGPTIEAVEGDRVRILVTNTLPEPTAVHWHGVLVPNGMDGVQGLTQDLIAPGKTFKYELTFTKPGT